MFEFRITSFLVGKTRHVSTNTVNLVGNTAVSGMYTVEEDKRV